MTQIVIQLLDDGKFTVNAPLENKILCLGLLELAKKAVLDHHSAIVRPASEILPEFGKRN